MLKQRNPWPQIGLIGLLGALFVGVLKSVFKPLDVAWTSEKFHDCYSLTIRVAIVGAVLCYYKVTFIKHADEVAGTHDECDTIEVQGVSCGN